MSSIKPVQQALPTKAPVAATQPTQPSMTYPKHETFCKATKKSLDDPDCPPIIMDYWNDSLNKKVYIGFSGSGPTLKRRLCKTPTEYTSDIVGMYVGTAPTPESAGELIIRTRNSIYIVSNQIQQRHVTFPDEN